ncbi:alpha,alpha-phosphotrehalase [Vagococcus elongatus]|uniref:Alpha,alpha-phosphotrehalase n=1 Tax=Vagococcus elongatus TaxID=180344 RepID=A0A430B1B3_9ENTE|nr:alpha,alpha-phosphotrehalase [Vagococcus elongatus]RSU14012.1 alpha,alpha-phosphotrehalase [Vagococcus elongatus]
MTTFKEMTVYQIYPKSFYDSNGDGVGDLQGIIEKIPYIKELGVDMVWLNPIFPSPQKDNGYDVSNYQEIDPLYGTMEEFELLVSLLEKEGIGVMLDMVFNHTSTEHPWFQQALSDEGKYRDYYLLRQSQEDGSLPTNWQSKFSGPTWAKFGNTDYYYLHLFDVSQADLNWRNSQVRQELRQVLSFWLSKGVKGFRFDVINLIGKDVQLVDAKPDEEDKSLYTDRPIVHDFLKEMNEKSFGRLSNVVTVGELSSTTVEQGKSYSNPQNRELDMVFNFHHLKVDYKDGQKWTRMPYDFIELKKIINEWQVGMNEGNGWSALFWNNHDQPRALNRFGHTGIYREKSAKMLAAAIHLLRGTPYIYQGEEIGMVNPDYTRLKDYRDVESYNAYEEMLKKGLTKTQALEILQEKSRDNARSPMQWQNSTHAGFTKGTPWINVSEQYKEINAESEMSKKDSVFQFYQQLIRLRKECQIISIGDYQPFLVEHPWVFAYKREDEIHELLVLNNFYEEEVLIELPDEFVNEKSSILISNEENTKITKKYRLSPFESIAILRQKT